MLNAIFLISLLHHWSIVSPINEEMVGNVLIGLQTDDCIQSRHTYHFWKKESHSGQNPKCLPQKRLFQSPKYRILLMRMRRKMMGKKEQQMAMMRSLRSATVTMGMTVADVSPAKSGNLPCDVTLSQGLVLA